MFAHHPQPEKPPTKTERARRANGTVASLLGHRTTEDPKHLNRLIRRAAKGASLEELLELDRNRSA
ncbi:hypothetical protein ACFT5B_06875 [Luteimicrobium sp. NPDC057192]|uniref:hypothetical protein n=1 Tax=Luteimicrobium sp. NPDC057192 TaxID=3346042 RepID=UPI0036316723